MRHVRRRVRTNAFPPYLLLCNPLVVAGLVLLAANSHDSLAMFASMKNLSISLMVQGVCHLTQQLMAFLMSAALYDTDQTLI